MNKRYYQNLRDLENDRKYATILTNVHGRTHLKHGCIHCGLIKSPLT